MDASKLAEIPLFAQLHHRQVETISRHADEADVPAGHQLIVEGRMATEVFLVLEGTAEVTKDGNHVADLGPGDVFGEIGVMEGMHRTASVTAKTPMKVVVMFAPEFTAMSDEIHELKDAICDVIGHRLEELRGAVDAG